MKIGDFGIARFVDDPASALTTAGQIVGTSLYLAPERALGRPASAASDVYSLGCVLYQLLTGRPPFHAETATVTLHQHIDMPPVPPREHGVQLPPAFENYLLGLLAKQPEDRPTAQEVADWFGTGAWQGPGGAPARGVGHEDRRLPRRSEPRRRTRPARRGPPPPTPGPRRCTGCRRPRPSPSARPHSRSFESLRQRGPLRPLRAVRVVASGGATAGRRGPGGGVGAMARRRPRVSRRPRRRGALRAGRARRHEDVLAGHDLGGDREGLKDGRRPPAPRKPGCPPPGPWPGPGRPPPRPAPASTRSPARPPSSAETRPSPRAPDEGEEEKPPKEKAPKEQEPKQQPEQPQPPQEYSGGGDDDGDDAYGED